MSTSRRTVRDLTKRAISNCRNAHRSTGPKTAGGKLRSSKNALRHGYNTPPSPAATLTHLRRILSDPTANVSSSLETEIGRAAVALAIAEARLDRIIEDRSTLQAIDEEQEIEIEGMTAALPRYEGEDREAKWMREALTFYLQTKSRSRRTFQRLFERETRYLAHAYAARRKALLEFISKADKNYKTKPN